ncbi:MAG: ATP-binding protein, partial [Actinobacteria bacterium]|nr:ATP-binding protein [Actinomycetota bacterium]
GLGLALVREHVRLHGGRVWVERRRDGASGARFVVELPCESLN